MTAEETIEMLKVKLNHDIEEINKKLNKEYVLNMNSHREIRLRGMKTKCMEILQILSEVE